MPRVVCLHGLRRTPADWEPLRAGLPPGWELAAPRLPGSPRAALPIARAALPGDAVIGHSMGAVLALRLAAERPVGVLVLTGSFFPPARNGRGTAESVLDYLGHRAALARALVRERPAGERSPRSAGALGMLLRQASGRGVPEPGPSVPVLVVHARDDHHVPIAFAEAAVARHPGWELRVLDHGGHHAHVDEPDLWLGQVLPWLRASRAAHTLPP